jgi:D-alanyl-D-alanine dipeptidase
MNLIFTLALCLSTMMLFAQARHQLVDVQKINPRIVIELRYATTNNFMKKAVYPSARCLLQKPVAERLSRVQARLEKEGLGLKIFDAYRPLSAQWELWKIVPNPTFVADPRKGSKHNRGAAVDVTLLTHSETNLQCLHNTMNSSKPLEALTTNSHAL